MCARASCPKPLFLKKSQRGDPNGKKQIPWPLLLLRDLDPTAYHALKPIIREEAELDGKVNFLIKVLKYIIAESGFELLARIELRDKRTGRCFR